MFWGHPPPKAESSDISLKMYREETLTKTLTLAWFDADVTKIRILKNELLLSKGMTYFSGPKLKDLFRYGMNQRLLFWELEVSIML